MLRRDLTRKRNSPTTRSADQRAYTREAEYETGRDIGNIFRKVSRQGGLKEGAVLSASSQAGKIGDYLAL